MRVIGNFCLLSIILLFVGFFFTSCGSDDENEDKVEQVTLCVKFTMLHTIVLSLDHQRQNLVLSFVTSDITTCSISLVYYLKKSFSWCFSLIVLSPVITFNDFACDFGFLIFCSAIIELFWFFWDVLYININVLSTQLCGSNTYFHCFPPCSLLYFVAYLQCSSAASYLIARQHH